MSRFHLKALHHHSHKDTFPMRPVFYMILVMLNGCGAEKSREKDLSTPPVLPLITTRDQPVVYELADPSCQTRMELVNRPLALTETWITTTSGEDVIREAVTLPPTLTGDSLQNEAVAKTTYGEQYERVCDFRKPKQARCVEGNGREISFYRRGLNGPLPLKICRDQHQYPQDSYEGVSLTAAYQLSRTRQFYLKAAPESPPPRRVVLSMFPSFSEIYDYFPQLNKAPGRLITYMTHNLAYFPETEEIVVFPETVNAPSNHKLWESPFVLSHEYGHHIDHIRHKNSYSQAGLIWSATRHSFLDLGVTNSLDLDLGKASFQALQGGKPLSMTPKALLTTAMGEAFADMIAFYTQGESSASILTFDDIGTDRDILNSRFANGLEKILSKRYTDTFFNQFETKATESNLHIMTGVHTIGAILAFGVHELFSSLTITAVDYEAGTLAKYRMLLSLMDKFTTGLGKLDYQSSTEDVLGVFAGALQKTLDQALPALKAAVLQQNPENGADTWKKIKSQICDQLGSNFPELREDGFKVEDPC